MPALTQSRVFAFTFFLPPLRTRSPTLFQRLLCCVSTSIGSPFNSIALVLLHIRWELRLNGCIFVSSSIRGGFRLELWVISFSSIFVCFHWYCYFIDYLFAFCGFGSVSLFAFVFVGLLDFVWPLLYKRYVFIIFEMEKQYDLNGYLYD